MKITVKSEAIRRNLELLKELIKKGSDLPPIDRKNAVLVEAFIEKGTGDLRLPKHGVEQQETIEKTCKLVQICLPKANPIFEVIEPSSLSRFDLAQAALSPEASKVMQETMQVLNALIADYKEALSGGLPAFLKEFSSAEVSAFSSTPNKKDIVHEAWYQVDRMEAEDLLLHKPSGTFLFRKDSFATLLEQTLRRQTHQPIACFTLTYIEPYARISDRTIVQKDNRFILYDDSPKLLGPSYATVEELLEQAIADPLLFPLLHTT